MHRRVLGHGAHVLRQPYLHRQQEPRVYRKLLDHGELALQLLGHGALVLQLLDHDALVLQLLGYGAL